MMYFPSQVNRFQKSILLIFQYKYLNRILEILFSRIWSSAQNHTVLVLLLNLVGFFISIRPRWSFWNVLYHCCTSFEGASRGGEPLIIFTWFPGACGTSCHFLHPSALTTCCIFLGTREIIVCFSRDKYLEWLWAMSSWPNAQSPDSCSWLATLFWSFRLSFGMSENVTRSE